MDETTAGTTEDYQENLTVDYSEMPTSIGFTSNKTTILLLLNIKSMVSYIKEQLYSLAMIKSMTCNKYQPSRSACLKFCVKRYHMK